MGLVLDFNIIQSKNNEVLVFKELTENYTLSNTGGWESPNPPLSDAISAELIITLPDETTAQTAIDLFAQNFPTDDTTLEYEIDMSMLGGSSGNKFEDGLYKVEYVVELSGSRTFSTTHTFLLYGKVKCCVDKMVAALPARYCSCKDDKFITNALLATTLLEGLEKAACCGQTDKFDNLLTILNRLCDPANCGCN